MFLSMHAQVYGDATILFPLIISQKFAKRWTPLDQCLHTNEERHARP